MTPPDPLRIILGDNNVWALPLAPGAGGGWLLVDAGIDYDDGERSAWSSALEQLAAHGIAPGDVRRVVVTHEHIDHAGLAARWAAEGARIIAGRAAIPSLVAGRESNEAQREPRLAELRRHGCPDDLIERLRPLRGRRHLRWEPCPADALDAAEEHERHPLADGGTLRLIPAPGHTPGNLVAFLEADEVPTAVRREPVKGRTEVGASGRAGILFSGDTLLPTTIPTPGLHFPAAVEGDPSAPRWPSLPPFLDSAAALRALEVRGIYPGHGEVVDDPARLFDQFDAHHTRRARRVRAALRGALPHGMTAYEVARILFRRLPERRIGQAVTEVIGHLDVLEESETVERLPGEQVRWRLLGE